MKKLLAVSVMLFGAVLMLGSTIRGTVTDVEPAMEVSAPVIEIAERASEYIEPECEVVVATSVQNDPAPVVDEAELEMLACVIYQEAGGDAVSNEARYMVGDVVLNRIADERFPDTMEEVLMQERQYGRFYWTGIVWPDRAEKPEEAAAVERAYAIAYDLLSDTYHSKLYNEGYIWQAEFEQGHDIIALDGIYFGK